MDKGKTGVDASSRTYRYCARIKSEGSKKRRTNAFAHGRYTLLAGRKCCVCRAKHQQLSQAAKKNEVRGGKGNGESLTRSVLPSRRTFERRNSLTPKNKSTARGRPAGNKKLLNLLDGQKSKLLPRKS